MSKIVLPLAALAVAFAPTALANGPQEIKVEFEYDGSVLADDAGARSVLASLNKQAKDACTYNVPLFGFDAIDRRCAKDLVANAVSEIVAERNADGLKTAALFERKATVEVASLEQR